MNFGYIKYIKMKHMIGTAKVKWTIRSKISYTPFKVV